MADFFSLTARSQILAVSNRWKDRRDQAEELLRDVEEMLRSLWLTHVGLLDAQGVANRMQARSKYGAKRPKAGKK